MRSTWQLSSYVFLDLAKRIEPFKDAEEQRRNTVREFTFREHFSYKCSHMKGKRLLKSTYEHIH